MTNGRLNLILYFSNRLVTFTVICWFNHFWLSWSLLIGKFRKVDLSHMANSWLVTISLRGIQNISDCWQPFSIPQRSQNCDGGAWREGRKEGKTLSSHRWLVLWRLKFFLMHIVYITGNPWVCEAPVWLRGWSCWYISNTITKERCFSGHTTH